MNRKIFLKYLALIVLVPSIILTACSDNKTAFKPVSKKQTYTCPMHPQIVQNKPGTCPICGMELVPFDKNNTDESLTLNASQQALANITTVIVGAGSVANITRLNGRLVVDPEASNYISSRVAGRVERLYVKETGVPVSKGQPLYQIYSEDLATLQQEYLVMAAQATSFPEDQRFAQMERAARQKLLLYGQSEGQIKALVSRKKTDPYVTYFAPSSGTVSELSITEGQYVPEGGTIMKLEGYGQLWVEADVYPTEANKVKVGQRVQIVVAGYEDRPQNMTIQFITPALESGTQLMQVRGTIPNPNHQWQPGQQAVVLLPSSPSSKGLNLPVDAVIREQAGSHVWLETGNGKFEPRRVTTGTETSDRVEITSGLSEGDKVVATGAYLLYSEFVLKKGKNPLAMHQH